MIKYLSNKNQLMEKNDSIVHENYSQVLERLG